MSFIFRWWLVVEVLGLAALPLCLSFFYSVRDRGYPCAKALGILLVALITWLLASLKIVPFGILSIVISMLVVAGCSAVVLCRNGQSLARYFREQWGRIVLAEVGFAVVFLFFVFVRSLHPDIFGQEKFMDLGYLNSLLRASFFPPVDMWLSGHAVNYYYYGYFTSALITKLSAVPVEYAFNLALPLMAALGFSIAWSIGSNLTGSRLWGLVAGVAAVFLGNFQGFLQFVGGRGFEHFSYWESSRVVENTINEFPFFSFFHADLHPHVMGVPVALLMMAVCANCVLSRRQGIFAFGAGWGIVWRVVVAAAVFGSVSLTNPWDVPAYGMMVGLSLLYCVSDSDRTASSLGRQVLLAIAGTAAVVGGGVIFSLPFLSHFHSQFVGIGVAHAGTRLHELMTVFGILLFPVASYGLTGAREALSCRKASWLLPILLAGFYGAVLYVYFVNATIAVIGSLIVLMVVALFRESRLIGGWLKILMPVCGCGLIFLVGSLVLKSHALGGGLAVPMSGVVVGMIGLSVLMLMADVKRPTMYFAVMLALIAFVEIFGCELLFLKDNYGSKMHRMNTIFKAYFQAWFLLAVVSPYFMQGVSKRIMDGISVSFKGERSAKDTKVDRCKVGSVHARVFAIGGSVVWGLVAIFLLFTGLCYPVLAVGQRWTKEGGWHKLTLDGMKYIERGHPGDYRGIQWLRENVKGQAIVLEAENPGRAYSYYSRVSVNTGLLTVLGWANHENVWRVSRPGDPYQDKYREITAKRGRQIKLIYTSKDYGLVKGLMEQLDVDYIFVGELERKEYGDVGFEKFRKHLEEVFHDPATDTFIYKVPKT